MEQWMAVAGYEGLYEVSSVGGVRVVSRAVDTAVLSLCDHGGYKRVYLSKDGIKVGLLVHRLVAIAFVQNPKNKPCINHINGIRSDNDVSNIEWCSHSENMLHSFRVLDRKPTRYWSGKKGYNHGCSKEVIQFSRGGIELGRFGSGGEAGRSVGTSCSHILSCCRGQRKTAGGYKWKYS